MKLNWSFFQRRFLVVLLLHAVQVQPVGAQVQEPPIVVSKDDVFREKHAAGDLSDKNLSLWWTYLIPFRCRPEYEFGFGVGYDTQFPTRATFKWDPLQVAPGKTFDVVVSMETFNSLNVAHEYTAGLPGVVSSQRTQSLIFDPWDFKFKWFTILRPGYNLNLTVNEDFDSSHSPDLGSHRNEFLDGISVLTFLPFPFELLDLVFSLNAVYIHEMEDRRITAKPSVTACVADVDSNVTYTWDENGKELFIPVKIEEGFCDCAGKPDKVTLELNSTFTCSNRGNFNLEAALLPGTPMEVSIRIPTLISAIFWALGELDMDEFTFFESETSGKIAVDIPVIRKPDLVVESLDIGWQELELELCQMTSRPIIWYPALCVMVRNDGCEPTESDFHCKFMGVIDAGPIFAAVKVAEPLCTTRLAPHETAKVWTGPVPLWTTKYRVTVDSRNHIDEMDETNNTGELDLLNRQFIAPDGTTTLPAMSENTIIAVPDMTPLGSASVGPISVLTGPGARSISVDLSYIYNGMGLYVAGERNGACDAAPPGQTTVPPELQTLSVSLSPGETKDACYYLFEKCNNVYQPLRKETMTLRGYEDFETSGTPTVELTSGSYTFDPFDPAVTSPCVQGDRIVVGRYNLGLTVTSGLKDELMCLVTPPQGVGPIAYGPYTTGKPDSQAIPQVSLLPGVNTVKLVNYDEAGTYNVWTAEVELDVTFDPEAVPTITILKPEYADPESATGCSVYVDPSQPLIMARCTQEREDGQGVGRPIRPSAVVLEIYEDDEDGLFDPETDTLVLSADQNSPVMRYQGNGVLEYPLPEAHTLREGMHFLSITIEGGGGTGTAAEVTVFCVDREPPLITDVAAVPPIFEPRHGTAEALPQIPGWDPYPQEGDTIAVGVGGITLVDGSFQRQADTAPYHIVPPDLDDNETTVEIQHEYVASLEHVLTAQPGGAAVFREIRYSDERGDRDPRRALIVSVEGLEGGSFWIKINDHQIPDVTIDVEEGLGVREFSEVAPVDPDQPIPMDQTELRYRIDEKAKVTVSVYAGRAEEGDEFGAEDYRTIVFSNTVPAEETTRSGECPDWYSREQEDPYVRTFDGTAPLPDAAEEGQPTVFYDLDSGWYTFVVQAEDCAGNVSSQRGHFFVHHAARQVDVKKSLFRLTEVSSGDACYPWKGTITLCDPLGLFIGGRLFAFQPQSDANEFSLTAPPILEDVFFAGAIPVQSSSTLANPELEVDPLQPTKEMIRTIPSDPDSGGAIFPVQRLVPGVATISCSYLSFTEAAEVAKVPIGKKSISVETCCDSLVDPGQSTVSLSGMEDALEPYLKACRPGVLKVTLAKSDGEPLQHATVGVWVEVEGREDTSNRFDFFFDKDLPQGGVMPLYVDENGEGLIMVVSTKKTRPTELVTYRVWLLEEYQPSTLIGRQLGAVTLRVGGPCGVYEPAFYRGEVNGDGQFDLADPIALLMWLFASGPAPVCLDAADVDDNGSIMIGDPIYLLQHLFAEGPAPLEPFHRCGADPTEDNLGCASFPENEWQCW